jgi:outer membrane usher protein FimD/PapC
MIRLEYAIDYQTLSGKISRKVFKISEFNLAAGEEKGFAKNQRFQDFTTRKHYPGPHRIDILVNGRRLVSGDFEVVV